jgi:hypothetical protein
MRLNGVCPLEPGWAGQVALRGPYLASSAAVRLAVLGPPGPVPTGPPPRVARGLVWAPRRPGVAPVKKKTSPHRCLEGSWQQACKAWSAFETSWHRIFNDLVPLTHGVMRYVLPALPVSGPRGNRARRREAAQHS